MKQDGFGSLSVGTSPTMERKRRFWIRTALWAICAILFAVIASGLLRWLALAWAFVLGVAFFLEFRGINRLTAPPSCSFCGKPQAEDRKLVQGPSVAICPSCVAICRTIIDRNSQANAD